MTRNTLNGLTPRTLRDAGRDPFDYITGPTRNRSLLAAIFNFIRRLFT